MNRTNPHEMISEGDTLYSSNSFKKASENYAQAFDLLLKRSEPISPDDYISVLLCASGMVRCMLSLDEHDDVEKWVKLFDGIKQQFHYVEQNLTASAAQRSSIESLRVKINVGKLCQYRNEESRAVQAYEHGLNAFSNFTLEANFEAIELEHLAIAALSKIYKEKKNKENISGLIIAHHERMCGLFLTASKSQQTENLDRLTRLSIRAGDQLGSHGDYKGAIKIYLASLENYKSLNAEIDAKTSSTFSLIYQALMTSNFKLGRHKMVFDYANLALIFEEMFPGQKTDQQLNILLSIANLKVNAGREISDRESIQIALMDCSRIVHILHANCRSYDDFGLNSFTDFLGLADNFDSFHAIRHEVDLICKIFNSAYVDAGTEGKQIILYGLFLAADAYERIESLSDSEFLIELGFSLLTSSDLSKVSIQDLQSKVTSTSNSNSWDSIYWLGCLNYVSEKKLGDKRDSKTPQMAIEEQYKILSKNPKPDWRHKFSLLRLKYRAGHYKMSECNRYCDTFVEQKITLLEANFSSIELWEIDQFLEQISRSFQLSKLDENIEKLHKIYEAIEDNLELEKYYSVVKAGPCLLAACKAHFRVGEIKKSCEYLTKSLVAFEKQEIATHIDGEKFLETLKLCLLLVNHGHSNFANMGISPQRSSSIATELVSGLPPKDVAPWSGMRRDFETLHSNWLSWCLEDASRFEMIPEVLSAVQGRELAASIAEQLAAAEGLDPEGPLARFIDARAELREMLERMHRMAGTGMGGDGLGGRMMAPGGFSDGPNPALEQLSKDYEEKRRSLQALREDAAKEPGFAALGAAQEAIKLEALQAVLDANEQLLLLFSHGDSGHALLIGSEGAPEHLALPEMPAMVQQYKRLEKTLTGRGAVRRNTAAEAELNEAEALSAEDYASFWADQEATLKRTLWDPLADKLVKGGTLLVASAGDLHNLSLEPGKPKHIGLMTRLPGLAFFALSRGLYGNNSASAAPAESTASVAILADDSAHDIPLVRREGELAARFWQEVGTAPEYPTNWPGGADRPLRFLHVAGHGTLQPGLAGSRHSVILQGETRIGEPEILRAPRAREALINICVAGQSHDNPLDGNPSGIVPGFLRHDTNWIVASLVALPDTWALLAGLILTDLRSASDADLPELLDKARTRLTHGGWPDRVSTAFAEALIAAINEPRYGPDRGTEGELNKRTSLRDAIDGDLAAARRDMLDRSRELIANSIRTNAPLHWWLAADPDLTERLIANPDDLDTTLNAAIKSAVAQAQSTGAPDLPEVQTTRHGWTLFGDPKKKA